MEELYCIWLYEFAVGNGTIYDFYNLRPENHTTRISCYRQGSWLDILIGPFQPYFYVKSDQSSHMFVHAFAPTKQKMEASAFNIKTDE